MKSISHLFKEALKSQSVCVSVTDLFYGVSNVPESLRCDALKRADFHFAIQL